MLVLLAVVPAVKAAGVHLNVFSALNVEEQKLNLIEQKLEVQEQLIAKEEQAPAASTTRAAAAATTRAAGAATTAARGAATTAARGAATTAAASRAVAAAPAAAGQASGVGAAAAGAAAGVAAGAAAGAAVAASSNGSFDWPTTGLTGVIVCAVYLVLMGIAGWIYGTFFTFAYPPLRQEPVVTRENFSFGLFRGLTWDPDWRICMFSFCCMPVRWADTVSSSKIGFMGFWAALFLFAGLSAISQFTMGLSALYLLVLAVMNRQKMRAAYGMPNKTWQTVVVDTCVWLFCAPCATMQEAMEVEFVDPPLQESMNMKTLPKTQV